MLSTWTAGQTGREEENDEAKEAVNPHTKDGGTQIMINVKRETNAKKKPRGKPFEKGNAGGGRPALPDDIRAARAMSYEEHLRTIMEVRRMTPAELKKMNMETMSFGKRGVITDYAKNNTAGIKIHEDRLFGKAVEKMEIIEQTITINQEDPATKAILEKFGISRPAFPA